MEENNENIETTVNEENKKNNNGLIIGIIIAAVVVLLVVGCAVFGKEFIGKNLVGYYELFEMSSGDENYSHEDLESLKSLGLEVTLELREDKTGTLNLFGESMELTYDGKNMTVDGESAPYSFKDGKITMEQDGEKLVFEKTEKTENTESAEEQK